MENLNINNLHRFPVAKSILILVAGLLMGLFVVAAFGGLLTAYTSIDKIGVVWIVTALQNFLVFAFPALVVGFIAIGRPLHFLGLNKAPSVVALVGALLIYVVMTPAMNWLVQWNEAMTLPDALKPVEDWMRAQEQAAKGTTDLLLSSNVLWEMLLTVLCVGILTGIGEEVFFRGALQRICFEGTHRRHLAIWITAFVFSALHFQFFGFVPRMVLGLLFGYLYFWSGSLWVPIVCHAVNNSLVVVFSWLTKNNVQCDDVANVGSSDPVLAAISGGVAIALLIAYCYLLKKLNKSERR